MRVFQAAALVTTSVSGLTTIPDTVNNARSTASLLNVNIKKNTNTNTKTSDSHDLNQKSLSDSKLSHKKKQAPGAGDALEGATGRVKSLMDLIGQLKSDFIKEFKEAEDTYNQQSCTHENTIKESKKTMAAAIASIADLTAKINKNSADIGSLGAVIDAHKKDIAAKEKEVADAIENRKKEHVAYAATVQEFTDNIKSAQLAYEVLTSAKDSSLKKTQSLLSVEVRTTAQQKQLLQKIKQNLSKIPLNNKVMTVDKIEALTEYLDDTIEKFDNQSSNNAVSLVQFGPASDRVMGTLKDMRGQYVAKLQGAQQGEQEAASAHVAYVERARALISAMQDSLAAREADLAAAEASKEANLSERDEKSKEKEEMDKLIRETTDALATLAKEWGVTTKSHNDEQNGIAKALDYLSKQQKVGNDSKGSGSAPSPDMFAQKPKPELEFSFEHRHATRLALIQTVQKGENKQDKLLYDNMFQKIVWAIEDMVKTHETTLADNKSRREECNQLQTSANSAAARKKAAIEALTRRISELNVEVESTKNEIKSLKAEKLELEGEIKKGQSSWEKSDASREKEVTELQASVKLIAGATEALTSSGSDRMGDVVAIMDMLKNECITSIDALGKARSEESKAWTEKKTTMGDLVISLAEDIVKNEAKVTGLEKEIGMATSKKNKVIAQAPMNMDECKNFLSGYQKGQDDLNQKIQDLTSAKSHLSGWKNSSKDAEHFDSSATDYVAPP